MNSMSVHKFSIGSFICYSILDGQHDYKNPAALLFPDASRDQLRKELLRYQIILDQWMLWSSDYTCLLVDTGIHRVLIDSGAGAFLPQAGRLVENMRVVGFDPVDIDIIILSHAHPDHIGGVAFFPDAKIIMSRNEWLFWQNKPQLPRLPQAMSGLLLQMIPPVLTSFAERVELIDDGLDLVPGIKIFEATGHTPGHLAISITSDGQKLLYTGDAILHPLHMAYPYWNAIVDIQPEKARQTRESLLKYALCQQATIFSFHFPFPAIGSVRQDSRQGNGYRYIACSN